MFSSHGSAAAVLRHPEAHDPPPPESERRRRAVEQSEDRIITLYDVSWEAYEAIGVALGDRGSVRTTYLEGTLELMSPGWLHELVNGTLGRLLEVFADEAGIEVSRLGHTTFRKKAKERGIEPDECYFREEDPDKVPDLAIEIVVTSGAVDKLDVYAGLGVPEVWFWQNGKISVHWLRSGGYEQKKRSRLFPGIDIAELEELLRSGTQSYAVRTYRARLRARRRKARAAARKTRA